MKLRGSDWIGVALLVLGAVLAAASVALMVFGGPVDVAVGAVCLVVALLQMVFIGRALWRELT